MAAEQHNTPNPSAEKPTLSRRAALLVTPVVAASAPALAACPDAELIAACRAFPAASDASNAYPGDLEPGVPEWDRYASLLDFIGEHDAHTLEGWILKAKAAIHEATQPDGRVEPEGTHAANWAWDLMNDMLRMLRAA